MLGCALVVFATMSAPPHVSCPEPAAAETDRDCPYALAARRMVKAGADAAAIEKILRADVPQVATALVKDREGKAWRDLWGEALNVDENTHATVVAAPILSVLARLAGVAAPRATVHAGLQHTYGYLFSLMQTPFGYKRARWVNGELENGFGLPANTLSPTPANGTLLANVTYFLGRLVLDETAAARLPASDGVHPALRAFDYRKAEIRRLEERVAVDAGARRVVIRTDLVRFPLPQKNSFLLIYSADDSTPPGARLYTAFPVDARFAEGLFAAERQGVGQAVKARFNSAVPGFAPGREITGERVEQEWRAR